MSGRLSHMTARYLVPIRRLFPIWRYEPIHWNADDMPDAFAWCPGWYRMEEITAEQRERIAAGEKPDMSWFGGRA